MLLETSAEADEYPPVDVAVVAESTYPYLKGGVSAVIHDIVRTNDDLTFGIVHITWNSASPRREIYDVPPNVRWIQPVYLSMQEHRGDFLELRPRSLAMRHKQRRALASRLFDVLEHLVAGEMQPFWELYDEGMNPLTRSYPLWALLGTREFMSAVRERLPGLGLPLVDVFWLMREFFSLSCAVLGNKFPRAGVYHAHTTGYAALLGAAAARQNDGRFLLTEHNLYVRDTVNMLLNRSMALPLTAEDWRNFGVSDLERAWMAWWIEMGRLCYPTAEVITYLYPQAITEAADLGAPMERASVIPNGMVVAEFDSAYAQRVAATEAIKTSGGGRAWRLAYIARVVPIKGLSDLISTVAILLNRGVSDFHLDVLGPTDHDPQYYQMCRDKARALGVEHCLTFHGTVNVRDMLGGIDLLVLPSYNEGQPIVVLEAMAAGIPVVGTLVGGMGQLVEDVMTTAQGRTWGACGLLVTPEYATGLANAIQTVLRDVAMYETFAANARGRVESFFRLEDAMDAYNQLYRELSGLPPKGPTAAEHLRRAGGNVRVADIPVPLLPKQRCDSDNPPSSAGGNRSAKTRVDQWS